MSKEINYKCDICSSNEPKYKGFELQVIFTTEQDEGRGVDHYLSDEKLDLCENCMKKILKGNYVFAEGAMGHNKYCF